MDQAHDLLGAGPVLLPITEENAGIESCTHPGCGLIADKDVIEKTLQPFLVGNDRPVILFGLFIQHLEVAAEPVKSLFQVRLLQQRQDGNMVFNGIREFNHSRTALLLYKAGCDRQYEQLHLAEVSQKLLSARYTVGRIIVPDGGIGSTLQDLFRDRLEQTSEIRLIAAEIDPGLPLGTDISAGLPPQTLIFRHDVFSFVS